MKRSCLVLTLGALALLLTAPASAPLRADAFGSGANSFTIDFVTIGQPGNPPDRSGSPSPAGSVPYSYRIGKYEISEGMIDKANALGGLGLTHDGRGPDKPATSVSWLEAARFVNWLNTSTGNSPAYKFDAAGDFQLWSPSDPGYDSLNLFRNRHAKYFLPSTHEWYKAAYYDPAAGVYYDYPTGSNSEPVSVASGTAPGSAVYRQLLAAGPADVTQAGGLSPYGTMAQGGNVGEWEETEFDLINDATADWRGGRGGGWATLANSISSRFRDGTPPTSEWIGVGLRVASMIPEPNMTTAWFTAFLLLPAVGRQRLANHKPHVSSFRRSRDAHATPRME